MKSNDSSKSNSTNHQLDDYLKKQFKQLASAMFPDGLNIWYGPQHRDMIRLFMGGALIMDAGKSPELEMLVEQIADPDWTPDSSWRWPASIQN